MSSCARREFLAIAAGLAAGVTLRRAGAFMPQPASTTAPQPPPKAKSATFFEWSQLREGVHVALGGGGNALVLASKGEALLVDCKMAPYGAVLWRELPLQSAKLTTVVNTHHHADHTGGNHVFTGTVPVLAQERCRPRVLAQVDRYLATIKQASQELAGDDAKRALVAPDVTELIRSLHELGQRPAAFAPTETFADERELRVGGLTVRLVHPGHGHTDNDVFVHVPDLNFIHTGDLLFHERHPYMDRDSGANSAGWLASLKTLIDLCDDHTVVVPGHGAVTDVTGLRLQREYFGAARALIEERSNRGMDRKQAIDSPVPGFEYLAEGQVRALTLGAIYDEMKAGRPEATPTPPK